MMNDCGSTFPVDDDNVLGGTKNDTGKPRVDLVPPGAILAAARVFTFGADKYGAHNWNKGILTSRLYAAVQRHLLAWWNGEDLDLESGLSHLDHALTGLMMLEWTARQRPDMDDRPAWLP